jgi:hypothetical protein
MEPQATPPPLRALLVGQALLVALVVSLALISGAAR